MVKYENDSKTKKIYIWKDENPLDVVLEEKLEIEVPAKEAFWKEGMICVEAKMNPRHISNYAMLCMNYKANNSGKTNIIINYNIEKNFCRANGQLFNDNSVIGLNNEFAEYLNTIFSESEIDFPSGIIEIIGGAYDEVGSSYYSFEKIIELISIIFENYEQIGETILGEKLIEIL
jgi:hypothetical protein